MGFKKRARQNRKKISMSAVTKQRMIQRLALEERAIREVVDDIINFNTHVRGFSGAGSCISDSMLFTILYNKRYKTLRRARAVCCDVSGFGSTGREFSLWHKGHDGNDPEWPEPRSNPKFYSMGATGYDGHVVAQTEHYIVDLTIGQINRNDPETGHRYFDVELAHVFPIKECVPLQNYPDWLGERLTAVKTLEHRPRQQLEAGQDMADAPLLEPFTATHPCMHDEAVRQEQIYIYQFYSKQDVPHLDGTIQPLQTTIAWALRPDIDFHTEVNVLRKWFTDDYSNDIKYNAKMLERLKKQGVI